MSPARSLSGTSFFAYERVRPPVDAAASWLYPIDCNTQGLARMRKDQSLVARLTAGAGAALLAAGLMADAAAAEPDMSKESRIAEKMNELGGKALGTLAGKRNDATVIVSPYSLGSALHLLMLGTTRASKAEQTLKTSLVPSGFKGLDETRQGFQAVNKLISEAENDKVQLKSASAVFVPASNETAVTSPNFKKRAKEIFGAEVGSLDFNKPEALATINGWVKGSTKGEIPTHPGEAGARCSLRPAQRRLLQRRLGARVRSQPHGEGAVHAR